MKVNEVIVTRVPYNNHINHESTGSSNNDAKETDDVAFKPRIIEDIVTISRGGVERDNESGNIEAIALYTNHTIPYTNDTTSELSLPLVSQEDQEVSQSRVRYVFKEILKLFFAASVGAGMTPIISDSVYKLENYGIYINDTEPMLIASTINTIGIYGLLGYMKISGLLDGHTESHQELSSCKKLLLHGSKIAAVVSSLLPVTQLWKIEFKNQEIAGSSDFDQYMLWAIICTVPLLIYRTLKAYKILEKRICSGFAQTPLDGSGQRIFTIGVSILAQIARSIIYTSSVSELSRRIGLNEELSLVVGIICGGIVASLVISMMEFSSLKSLFKKQETSPTLKEVALGTLCAVEASWFTLPLMSTSADALKDYNLLTKSSLLTALFISHTAKEANSIYHNINVKHTERRPEYNISA